MVVRQHQIVLRLEALLPPSLAVRQTDKHIHPQALQGVLPELSAVVGVQLFLHELPVVTGMAGHGVAEAILVAPISLQASVEVQTEQHAQQLHRLWQNAVVPVSRVLFPVRAPGAGAVPEHRAVQVRQPPVFLRVATTEIIVPGQPYMITAEHIVVQVPKHALPLVSKCAQLLLL